MAKYYDIDDIITEEEKAASGVGIDPSAEMDFVEAGSKVELPFWLAHELHLRQAVSINDPSCFNQKQSRRVADRTIEFLLLPEFKSRYKEVLTKAHTAAFAAGSKFWTILTKEEINLYETSSICNRILQEVANGGSQISDSFHSEKKEKIN